MMDATEEPKVVWQLRETDSSVLRHGGLKGPTAGPPARPALSRVLAEMLMAPSHSTLLSARARVRGQGLSADDPANVLAASLGFSFTVGGYGARRCDSHTYTDAVSWRGFGGVGEAMEALVLADILPSPWVSDPARGWTDFRGAGCASGCAPISLQVGHSVRCDYRRMDGTGALDSYAPRASLLPPDYVSLAGWASLGAHAVLSFEEWARGAVLALGPFGAPPPSNRVFWRITENVDHCLWDPSGTGDWLATLAGGVNWRPNPDTEPLADDHPDVASARCYGEFMRALHGGGVALCAILSDGTPVLALPPFGRFRAP